MWPYEEESNYDAREHSPSTKATDNNEKAANMDARGLKKAFDDSDSLGNSDFAGLDVLGFGQSQRHEALIDLRADFVGVD